MKQILQLAEILRSTHVEVGCQRTPADSKKTVSQAVDNNSDEKDNDNESVNNQDSSPVNEDQSSDSTIQSRRSNKKSGWCYVGTDRNARSCIKVDDSTKCMSGNIFPSRTLCINPNLRS